MWSRRAVVKLKLWREIRILCSFNSLFFFSRETVNQESPKRILLVGNHMQVSSGINVSFLAVPVQLVVQMDG